MVAINNVSGKNVAYLGISEDLNGGFLEVGNKYGDRLCYLGISSNGGGINKIYNNREKSVSYLGTNNDGHGMIVLSDKYGDEKWGQSAED